MSRTPRITSPEEVIALVRKILEEDKRIRYALVFGSLAAGTFGASSDVDVGVAFEKRLSMDDQIDISMSLSVALDRNVDVVDLRTATGVLLQQLLAKRITLVKRDETIMPNLMVKRVYEEMDLMPLFERIWSARRERKLAGGKVGP